MATQQWQPQEVSELEIAFPASVKRLMPTWDEIPAEFKRQDNPWAEWQRRWFFKGLQGRPSPKQGIDGNKAMRHLSVIQRSFEPKHEHKEAAVAYLASLWFTNPTDNQHAPPQEAGI